MIDLTLVSLFIPTFFIVSLTPGMCMTLAMTLGMKIGVKRTLWMMMGELIGVTVVAVASVLGVAAIMLKNPTTFIFIKFAGASYLLYVSYQMFTNKGKLAIKPDSNTQDSFPPLSLFSQGLFTAISNPKGWAFMISLLPPFINKSYALPLQLIVLIGIIIVSEFICMVLYAAGGKTIGRVLTQQKNVKLLNKISALLMLIVAIWLLLS